MKYLLLLLLASCIGSSDTKREYQPKEPNSCDEMKLPPFKE